jgi:hypothetical protein
MSTIQEFNYDLADRLIKYDINDYFKLVHSKYYKNINIEFMEYFLSLIPKKQEFCVEQEKLQEYKVINTDKSNHILRALEKFNLKENEDYLLPNVGQQDLTAQHGGSNKKEYILTPYAFKLCLIRAKNSFEFANYYLMLEEVFYYYREYQNQYQTKLLSMKDDKIDRLLEENKEQSKQMKEQSKQIAELLGYAKDTKSTLDETKEILVDVQTELADTKDDLDDLVDKVDDLKYSFEETASRSVPNPADPTLRSEFILLQSQEEPLKFKFIRGIQTYNDSQINTRYQHEYNIIRREYNANPIQLFKLFKEVMNEEYNIEKEAIRLDQSIKHKRRAYHKAKKMEYKNTNLTLLNNFTLEDLLQKINEVTAIRYKQYFDSSATLL